MSDMQTSAAAQAAQERAEAQLSAATAELQNTQEKLKLSEKVGPSSKSDWRLTDDAALMELVTSANVACGGHAGDAATMVHACALAADRGVSIGAHPGYDDKPGFGRRVIPLSMDEVEELVVCQVGALRNEAASFVCWGLSMRFDARRRRGAARAREE